MDGREDGSPGGWIAGREGPPLWNPHTPGNASERVRATSARLGLPRGSGAPLRGGGSPVDTPPLGRAGGRGQSSSTHTESPIA